MNEEEVNLIRVRMHMSAKKLPDHEMYQSHLLSSSSLSELSIST
jgi:hypothetical protein